MKNKTYFLILAILILIISITSSEACDNNKINLEENNQEIMLIDKLSLNTGYLNNEYKDYNEYNKIIKNLGISSNNSKDLTKNKTQPSSTTLNNSILDTKNKNYDKENDKLKNNKSTLNYKIKTSIKLLTTENTYKSKYIEAELIDSTGKKLKNTPIYLTVRKNNITKTYKLTTNEKGKIKVEIITNKTFSAKFEFKETTNYLASNSTEITIIKDMNISTITKIASVLKKYIEENGKIPKIIEINGIKLSNEEIFYLMVKTVSNINKTSTSAISLKQVNPTTNTNIKQINGQLYTKEYLNVTNNILKFIENNGRVPNYATTKIGNIPYSETVYIYSKILDFYNSKKRLCNYVTFMNIANVKNLTQIIITNIKNLTTKTNQNNSTIKSINQPILKEIGTYNIPYSILNNQMKDESINKYLVSTKNCEIDNNIIKLAKTLTSTLTNTYQKAKAIFNYVRDNITYKKYNNTLKGAKNTLLTKTGNCVDQSHLLIALARSIGIPARYVHGSYCKFTSGLVCGHVWVQLLIGNTWVVADSTSYKNSLGIVKNWNINSYYLNGKYSSLNF